jgi:hypothetical protein
MSDIVQFPQQVPFVDNLGRIDFRWLRVLQQIQQAAAEGGGGGGSTATGNFVIDGSLASYAQMKLYQGADASKPGSPTVGSIYFALDTGKIYYASSGSWNLIDAAITGDISKPAGSTVATLATVFPGAGTFGANNLTPLITVDEKGRVINIALQEIQATAVAGGSDGQLQFNNNGALDGAFGISYIQANQSLTFSNPSATFNNLSPLTTKGDVLVYSTSSTRLPVGVAGQVLTVSTTSNAGVAWEFPNVTSLGQVPYYVGPTESYTVAENKQVPFTIPITIDGYMILDGILVEVD